MSWSRSILDVDELRRALEAHARDGTELHGVVDRELRGLELENPAGRIKGAIEEHYRDSIPVDAAVEIIAKYFEIFA
jgi:hypothetical protein